MKPLAGRIIVEPIKEEEVSGFSMPTETQPTGIIISVGCEKTDEVMEAKEGDKIIYGKYAGVEINVDGKEYLVMKQFEILAFI